MRRFRHLGLAKKISLLLLFTNAVTTVLLAAVFVLIDYRELRQRLFTELSAVAETIGSNSTAALNFDDHRTAEENLAALRGDPRVMEAVIYRADGGPFAGYRDPRRGGQNTGGPEPPSGQTIEGDTVVLASDIYMSNERLGRIAIRADLSIVYQHLWRTVLLSLLVLPVTITIGHLLAMWFVSFVTGPIQSLTQAAQKLAERPEQWVELPGESKDEVGELTRCFRLMLDGIRERDRRLNRHKDDLEVQVRERTKELEEARVRAEEGARMKSEFLANMSHEIRTPMNGVIGLTALALETELSREARENLELVSLSASNLLTVINDILDFSKIEAGKMSLESIPFALAPTAGRHLKTLALPAHAKGLRFLCEVDPELPPVVTGDPVRLMQVLTNLVGNAVKFTAEGAIHVRVARAGDEQVSFSVSDTGVGIDPRQQERIFDSFTQADNSTTRKFGGTGLGLAISNRLVTLMGGSLQVESRPGSGSRFHFTLPLAAAGPALRSGAVRESLPPEVRVLIVDAEEGNRRVLERYARSIGLDACAVSSAAEALDLSRQGHAGGRPFRIVFSDIQLPGTDGLDLAGAMRAVPELSATQVLMLSSVDVSRFSGRRKELGLDYYLTKPVFLEDLYDVTRQILGAAPAAGQTSVRAASPLAPLQVLVAEDNAVNQRVLTKLLERLGHSFTVVSNGRDAVERSAASPFDLILMDCQMPDMDGFMAAKAIRAREASGAGHVPIIALTAYALKGDREKCLAAGMDDYLTKPVNFAELEEKLNTFATPRSGGPERPHPEPVQ